MGALQTSLIDFIYVAFWAGQDTENDFKLPFDRLKHRFLDLTQEAIWAGQ